MTGNGNTSIGVVACRREVPGQESVDPALLVAVDDGGERACQIDLRFNSVEYAGRHLEKPPQLGGFLTHFRGDLREAIECGDRPVSGKSMSDMHC